jgi:hypothetical protein
MSRVIRFPKGQRDAEDVFKDATEAGVSEVLVVGFVAEGDQLFLGATPLKLSDLLLLQRYIGDAVDQAFAAAAES